MKQTLIIIVTLTLLHPVLVTAQQKTKENRFPGCDFVLHDAKRKSQPRGVVLGPMRTDSSGKTTAAITVYGDVQVMSLSFSSDGRRLAVGSTPSAIDVWDMDRRAKVRSFAGGSPLALSPDGHYLATEDRKIQIRDASSGKLRKSIEREPGAILRMSFSPSGALLLVSTDGKSDAIYDVKTAQRVGLPVDTREAQFSRDGSLVVGAGGNGVEAWNTKDWSKARDFSEHARYPYPTCFAVHPDNDLVVYGGMFSAWLLRLSTGEEGAKVGTGYTNFAAFSPDGALVFTYTGDELAIWDTAGKKLCETSHMGNGVIALSPDGRWLAAPSALGSTDVSIWTLPSIIGGCDIR
jgi:WD40 repeat protein